MRTKGRTWRRVAVELPPDVDDGLREVAAHLGLSRNQLIALWLQEKLQTTTRRIRREEGDKDRTPATV